MAAWQFHAVPLSPETSAGELSDDMKLDLTKTALKIEATDEKK